MTSFRAVHAVGNSMIGWLRNTYPADLRGAHSCEFHLASSAEMATPPEDGRRLTLFLYRITMNQHLRNAGRGGRGGYNDVPLALDLHYLLTVWADTALSEQLIMGWAMQQLQEHPVLDASSLTPEPDWEPGDYIQVVPAELSTEDLMRIWDSLEPSYRLSISYVARVVRVDPSRAPDNALVVARRVAVTDGGVTS